jgi:hypothetical protein
MDSSGDNECFLHVWAQSDTKPRGCAQLQEHVGARNIRTRDERIYTTGIMKNAREREAQRIEERDGNFDRKTRKLIKGTERR